MAESSFPWEIVEQPEPGNAVSGYLTWPDQSLHGIQIPYFAVNGAQPGRAVAVTAAIHGGEYPGPAGAIRFANDLELADVHGSILILPLVNQTSFWHRTAFITPEDGRNLNRQFPGKAAGTYTEVLAYRLSHEIVGPADLLIDLHSGDVFETLASHVGFYVMDDPELSNEAQQLSGAFGIPIQLRSQAPEPPGRTQTAAAALAGKVSVLVEQGGNGLLSQSDEDAVYWGLFNTLRTAGVIAGEPEPTHPQLYDRVGTLTAETQGLWRPSVELQQQVEAGDVLGKVTDQFGNLVHEVTAPEAATVLYYLSSLAARPGDPLVSLVRPADD